jgi:hypothetical protein
VQLGVYVSERLSLRGTGKAAMKVMVANRTREIRPSGMTWGACGNVGMMGAGLRPIGKPMDTPPYPKRPRAPHFYPDLHTRQGEVLPERQGCRGRATANPEEAVGKALA